MKTVTLSQFREYHTGPAWAQPDCEHKPGMWRRDLSARGLHSRCITECRECGAVMRGTWTAWGRVTAVISVETKGKQ